MMDFPLLLKNVLWRAKHVFPNSEIVSRDFHALRRFTYAEFYERVCRLANVLQTLGVSAGERVGSFAWNTHRHLELYYAIPCTARVLHTINVRLFAEQIVYVTNHAEDRVLFVDEDLLPLIESLYDRLTTVKAVVVMTDQAELPPTSLPNVYHYEQLLAQANPTYEFPEFDENTTAIMAYTTATTGMPKGVEYSHRGLYLHSLMSLGGEFGTTDRDATLVVVPQFHVNAWGRPYSDLWAGAKLVLPGNNLKPDGLAELLDQEKVTMAVGVPTVWIGLLQYLQANPGRYDLSHVRVFFSGGSALPTALSEAFDNAFGIKLYQGYGQTETTPVTVIYELKNELADVLSPEEKIKHRAKSGLLVPGIEARIVDSNGQEVPRDGKTFGELWLRGPWVMKEYYKDPVKTAESFVDGWFRTGDIVVMDENGYIQVTDRAKDLIKSGGEWISSVDLENELMGLPGVAEAAVIGIPHPTWIERPLAVVVLKPGAAGVTKETILAGLQDKVAKWWLPDDVVFVQEIPRTSVGKFSKRILREMHQRGELAARKQE